MEVVGALASSLQLVSQCGQVTMTIVKWYQSVKTVDRRVASFVQEVETLGSTYESLQKGLDSKSVVNAAKDTDRDVGGHLWRQLKLTLEDCQSIIAAIIVILNKIEASSKKAIFRSNKRFESMFMQLCESLTSGDLARLREQVVMYNSSLQLPMQMIQLTIQLQQQEATMAQQLRVNENLSSLRDSIHALSRQLTVPTPPDQWEASTLQGNTQTEKKWRNNMEEYVGSAKKFLETASAAATTISIANASYLGDQQPANEEAGARRGSAWAPLTEHQLSGITRFVDDLPDETGSSTHVTSDVFSNSNVLQTLLDDSDDDDTELQVLQQLLQNGQERLSDKNYARAENDFRQAIKLSQENDFGSKVACTTTDMTLLLAECVVKQDKLDEAIVLLKPLVSPSTIPDGPSHTSERSMSLSPAGQSLDKGQVLSAHHLLGEVYLKKKEGDKAETHALQAYKGRKKLIGADHKKTIESVHLVINAYKAQDNIAMADAYHQRFLEPTQQTKQQTDDSLKADSPTPAQASLAAIAVSNTLPDRQRRPTFNLSGFRRSERQEQNVTPAPLPIASTSTGQQGFLKPDESNVLSTSPHNTSSPLSSPNAVLNGSSRHQSIDSTNFRAGLSLWKSSSDLSEQNVSHQRTQSVLSKAPTIFAALSRSEMEKVFLEVSALSDRGKTSKAVDKAIQILQSYDPNSTILIHRTEELKKNIEKSKGLGLAGTGYGFSPLHFFCSLGYEAVTEVEVLLRLGADVQALGYKAGYGKIDPFTALNLAITRNYESIVRMLLAHGATWQSNLMKRGSRYNADRDPPHPLLQACQKELVGIVEALLVSRLTVNEDDFPRKSWHGNSLLHEACFRCDVAMIEFLMRYAKDNGILHQDMYSFVGTPGQQDAFGMTPIMHAVDMRETSDLKLMERKSTNRIACLRLLLGDEFDHPDMPEMDGGDVNVGHLRRGSASQRLTANLYIEDKKGNTVFWYADESRGGDEALRRYLDEQSRKSQLIDI